MVDIESVLKATGYLGLFGIIFAESGLLIGLFFPGDSLLFTAGILASQGIFNIWLVVAIVLAAAISGVSAGYGIGKRYGPRIFKRQKSLFFDKTYVARSQKFYAQHGVKTLILARFVPVVRTLAPVLAGVGKMNYRTFLTFNIIGGLLWGITIPLLGYYLGQTVPDIERYILPIIAVIVIVSVLPSLLHVLKRARR